MTLANGSRPLHSVWPQRQVPATSASSWMSGRVPLLASCFGPQVNSFMLAWCVAIGQACAGRRSHVIKLLQPPVPSRDWPACRCQLPNRRLRLQQAHGQRITGFVHYVHSCGAAILAGFRSSNHVQHRQIAGCQCLSPTASMWAELGRHMLKPPTP